MSTASLRRHYFGLPLSLHVILCLTDRGITKESLATMAVDDLVLAGLSRPEAEHAIALARSVR